MLLVKVLKRRDASSVVVAVVVGFVLYQLVSTVTPRWASWLSNTNKSAYGSVDWKAEYLYPVVMAVLELLILEVLGWVAVWFKDLGHNK